jgi:hypothetical protein
MELKIIQTDSRGFSVSYNFDPPNTQQQPPAIAKWRYLPIGDAGCAWPLWHLIHDEATIAQLDTLPPSTRALSIPVAIRIHVEKGSRIAQRFQRNGDAFIAAYSKIVPLSKFKKRTLLCQEDRQNGRSSVMQVYLRKF